MPSGQKMSEAVRERLRKAAEAKRGRGPITSYDPYGFMACLDELQEQREAATREIAPRLVRMNCLTDWRAELHGQPARAAKAPAGLRLACEARLISYTYLSPASSEPIYRADAGYPGHRGDRVRWVSLARWPVHFLTALGAAVPSTRIVRQVYRGGSDRVPTVTPVFDAAAVLTLFVLLWPWVRGPVHKTGSWCDPDGSGWYDLTAVRAAIDKYLHGYTDPFVAAHEVK